MGSYSQITIGGYPMLSTKNYLYQWYFRKTDRTIRTRSKSQRNTLIWCEADPSELEELETDFLYVAPGPVIRRRLELDGFNYESLEHEFQETIGRRVKGVRELTLTFGEWERKQAEIIALLESATLTDWLDRLKIIVQEGITSWRWKEREKEYTDPLLCLMFNDNLFWDTEAFHDCGFPCQTLESMAVAMLEIMPEGTECVLDATDVVGGGWTDAFEDLTEYQKEFTNFYDIFISAVTDTQSLMALSPGNSTLARLLYSNIITAFETYLSDTMKKQIVTRAAVRRRFVESNETFKEKISLQDIFRRLENLNNEIIQAIDTMTFHNLDKTAGLYKAVLDTHLPSEHMADLKAAILKRHDIVHRNGKTVHGVNVIITSEDLKKLIGTVNAAVVKIDKQIKDGLLDDDDD
ncbi:HEPN/Toprim-associated domain-containing protein [Pseudomonas fulva]|uniref:HEPN/Toprim-associated domain-containing protein n=1 Tax=Pseudomonas fulva TaxID=47880 RepID=UPI00345CF687